MILDILLRKNGPPRRYPANQGQARTGHFPNQANSAGTSGQQFDPSLSRQGAQVIFRRGGGQKTAAELSVPFLGEIPLQSGIATGGDEGEPVVLRDPDSPAAKAFFELAATVSQRFGTDSEADRGLSSMAWQG